MKNKTFNIYIYIFSLTIITVFCNNVKALENNFNTNKIAPFIGINISKLNLDETSKEEDYSISLNAGFRFNLNNTFFITPEIYYNIEDDLYEETFTYIDPSMIFSYNLKGTNPYGAKINFGFNITEKFSATIFTGMSFYETELSVASTSTKEEDWEILFGLGVGYRLTDNIDLKLSYEIQEIDNSIISKVDLTKINFGVTYNF